MTRGFRLPDRGYLPLIFERLAISEEDRDEILAAWPSRETDPETWRALERAYTTLVDDLGGFAPLELPGPAVDSTPLGRYFFVYVYLAALADVRRFHMERRIPEEISWATLSDLGRNLKRDRLLLGDGGLRTSGWLTLHFRGSRSISSAVSNFIGSPIVQRTLFAPSSLRSGVERIWRSTRISRSTRSSRRSSHFVGRADSKQSERLTKRDLHGLHQP